MITPPVDAAVDAATARFAWSPGGGESLADHLAGGPMSAVDACDLAHSLLLGLDYAHAAGVAHVDLTPRVVFLDASAEGRLLASTCGVCVPLGELRRLTDDVRDVGALVYLALTGVAPGEPGDVERPLRAMTEVRPDLVVDAHVEAAVMRALGADGPPFESAAEMAELLRPRLSRPRGGRRPTATNPQTPRAVRSELIAIADAARALPAPLAPTPLDASLPTTPARSWLGPLVAAGLALLIGAILWVLLSEGERGPGAEAAAQAAPSRPEVSAARARPPTAAPPGTPTGPSSLTRDDTPVAPVGGLERAATTDATTPSPVAEPAASGPTAPPTPLEPSAPPAPPTPTEPVAPAEPTPSPTVTCVLTSTPAGATVRRGDVPLGTTPVDVAIPRADLPLELTFELDGYRPTERVIPVSDGNRIELEVALAKRAITPRPRPPKPPGDAPPPASPNTPPPILLGR